MEMILFNAGIVVLSICWWKYKRSPLDQVEEQLRGHKKATESVVNEINSYQRKINDVIQINNVVYSKEAESQELQNKKQQNQEIAKLETVYNQLLGPYNEKKRREEEERRRERERQAVLLAAAVAASRRSSSSSSYSSSSSSSGRSSWGGGGGGFSGGGASGGW